MSGLSLGGCDVYAYFWRADEQGFVFSGALTNNSSGGLPVYHAGDAPVTLAEPGNFSNPGISACSADRSLYQLHLGTITGTSFSVSIDDETNGGFGRSVWYDGVGYQLHLAANPAVQVPTTWQIR